MVITVTFKDRTTQSIEGAEIFAYSEAMHGYTVKIGNSTVVIPAKGILYATITVAERPEGTKEEENGEDKL